MTTSTGRQIISIDVLSNISRNNGNYTMKVGKLIEQNVQTIFLRKSC